jgi:hypothetical protein
MSLPVPSRQPGRMVMPSQVSGAPNTLAGENAVTWWPRLFSLGSQVAVCVP